MELLLWHREDTSKEIKEMTNVANLVILQKSALIFLTTVNFKLHQKFKNYNNDVKFGTNIVNPLIFH